MHRHGAGLTALDRHQQNAKSYLSLSSEIYASQLSSLQSQATQFRSALTAFSSNPRTRAAIRSDPNFRLAFQQMCISLGVDPLAGPRSSAWVQKSGFGSAAAGWAADLLGLGLSDWQYELGVQIVDVCVSTRERNGGVIEMGELIRILSKLRGVDGGVVTEDDVIRSIKTLQPLGAGYQIVEVDAGGGHKTKMVRSVVKELDADQGVILALAQEEGGKVVEEMLVRRKGWTNDRAKVALENMLLRDGLCWLDEQDKQYGRVYWVPSVLQWDDNT